MRTIIMFFSVFIFGIFLIKWFWQWTIPGIFPGAVEQNLISAKISWWLALKLSILFSIITSITTFSRKK